MEQTFHEFLKKTRKKNGEKFLPKSINQYVATIERHKDAMYDKTLSELIDYMNEKIVNFRNPTLRAAFRMYLVYLGVPEDDDRLKLLKTSKKSISALTSQRVLSTKVMSVKDIKLLYDSVDDEWKLIIGFLYDTGCREDELLTTKRRKITIYDEPRGGIYGEVSLIGKGGKSRTVFLSEATTTLLKRLRPNIQDDDLVFEFRMDNGKLYERQDKALYDGIMKRTKEILGVSHSAHHFRHSVAQAYADNGGDLAGISALLGHANFSTTQIYIKSSSAMARKMVEKYSEGLDESK